MKTFEKSLVIIWFTLLFILISGIAYSYTIKMMEESEFTNSNYKNCIIENKYYLQICEYNTPDNRLFEMYFKDSYYTDATIRVMPDSAYTIIFWGNRKSIMWDIRKDYSFTVEIPYNRSKGKDVSKDIKIFEICKLIELKSHK